MLTFSIYEDLVKSLAHCLNIYDCTIDESSSNNNIDGLRKSIFIISESYLNISLTIGGVSIINLMTSDSNLGLITKETHQFFYRQKHNLDIKSGFNLYTSNRSLFLQNLRLRLCLV